MRRLSRHDPVARTRRSSTLHQLAAMSDKHTRLVKEQFFCRSSRFDILIRSPNFLFLWPHSHLPLPTGQMYLYRILHIKPYTTSPQFVNSVLPRDHNNPAGLSSPDVKAPRLRRPMRSDLGEIFSGRCVIKKGGFPTTVIAESLDPENPSPSKLSPLGTSPSFPPSHPPINLEINTRW